MELLEIVRDYFPTVHEILINQFFRPDVLSDQDLLAASIPCDKSDLDRIEFLLEYLGNHNRIDFTELDSQIREVQPEIKREFVFVSDAPIHPSDKYVNCYELINYPHFLRNLCANSKYRSVVINRAIGSGYFDLSQMIGSFNLDGTLFDTIIQNQMSNLMNGQAKIDVTNLLKNVDQLGIEDGCPDITTKFAELVGASFQEEFEGFMNFDFIGKMCSMNPALELTFRDFLDKMEAVPNGEMDYESAQTLLQELSQKATKFD